MLGDVNNDGLQETSEQFPGDGSRKLFWLRQIPFREVTRVVADGLELPLDGYCTDPAAGWVSLAEDNENGMSEVAFERELLQAIRRSEKRRAEDGR